MVLQKLWPEIWVVFSVPSSLLQPPGLNFDLDTLNLSGPPGANGEQCLVMWNTARFLPWVPAMRNIWSQQNHWELKQKCRLWELAAPHYIPFKTVPYQLRVCSVGISVSLTPSWVLLLETGQLIARWRKEGILFGAFHSFPVPEIMLYMAVLMFPFIPRDFVPCFYFLSWIWGAGAES